MHIIDRIATCIRDCVLGLNQGGADTVQCHHITGGVPARLISRIYANIVRSNWFRQMITRRVYSQSALWWIGPRALMELLQSLSTVRWLCMANFMRFVRWPNVIRVAWFPIENNARSIFTFDVAINIELAWRAREYAATHLFSLLAIASEWRNTMFWIGARFECYIRRIWCD